MKGVMTVQIRTCHARRERTKEVVEDCSSLSSSHWLGDEKRPRGRQFHVVSCQSKVQTYQFDENISN